MCGIIATQANIKSHADELKNEILESIFIESRSILGEIYNINSIRAISASNYYIQLHESAISENHLKFWHVNFGENTEVYYFSNVDGIYARCSTKRNLVDEHRVESFLMQKDDIRNIVFDPFYSLVRIESPGTNFEVMSNSGSGLIEYKRNIESYLYFISFNCWNWKRLKME
jgi:hypothetical protein